MLGSLSGCDRPSPTSDWAGRVGPVTARQTDIALPTVAPARSPGAASPARTFDSASLAVLKEALASKDYATRLVAVEALGEAKLDSAVPWVEHALGDTEHDVRMAGVEALDRVHSPRARALLVTVGDDMTEELDIRAVAAGALIRTTP